jgi:hypothetical protein
MSIKHISSKKSKAPRLSVLELNICDIRSSTECLINELHLKKCFISGLPTRGESWRLGDQGQRLDILGPVDPLLIQRLYLEKFFHRFIDN